MLFILELLKLPNKPLPLLPPTFPLIDGLGCCDKLNEPNPFWDVVIAELTLPNKGVEVVVDKENPPKSGCGLLNDFSDKLDDPNKFALLETLNEENGLETDNAKSPDDVPVFEDDENNEPPKLAACKVDGAVLVEDAAVPNKGVGANGDSTGFSWLNGKTLATSLADVETLSPLAVDDPNRVDWENNGLLSFD